MKPKSTLRSFLALASTSLLAISYTQAATYYWDNNGATAGFGTATGTWDSAGTVGSGTLGWGTDVMGLIAPTGTITTLNTNSTTDALNFGTVAAGLAAGTITVNGNVSAGDITFGSASGAVVLSTGTITLTAAQTTTVNNTTDTISSILAGAGTSFTKAGTGTLILTGANTYTGTTIIRGGTLNLGNSTSTGSLASTALVLQGGTLSYTRNDSQTKNFSTTAINTGAAAVTPVAGNTLGLGDITRSTAGGTLAVGTTGTITTSDVNDVATGILGPWAFYGTQYATVTSGTIGGLTGTTQDTESNWTNPAANYEITITGTKTLTGNRTSNTLRYGTVGGTIALGASGSNTLTTNGILAVGGAVIISRAGGTGSVIAGSTGEIVIAGTQAVTISAPISSGAVTYSGTGVLILSGANNYAGGFTLNSGTVAVAGSTYAGFGSGGTLTVTGGTISGANSDVVNINNDLNWSGSLQLLRSGGSSGAPIITFNGLVTLSSDVKLVLSSTGGTNPAAPVFTNNISGAYGINVISDGPNTIQNTLTLSGTNNTFSGGLSLTLIKGMFLNINSATALGATAGTFTIGAGGVVTIDNKSAAAITLANNNPLALNNGFTFTGTRDLNMGTGGVNLGNAVRSITTNNAGTLTLGGVISNGGLTKAGAGTLALTGTNTFASGTSVTGGTLMLGDGTANTGNLSGTSAIAVSAGATLAVNRTGATGQFGDLNAKIITGAGSFLQAGSGTTTLGYANTYTGTITISNGTLSINSIANLSTNSAIGAPTTAPTAVIMIGSAGNTGTLAYTGTGHISNRQIRIGTNSTVPVVGDTGGATITANGASNAALTFNAANFNTQTDAATGVGADRVLTLQGTSTGANTISGIIQDNLVSGSGTGTAKVGVTKAQAGTWILSGANTYTGGTNVNAGTLSLGHATDTLSSSSAVTVDGATAVLSIAGNSDTVGAVSLKNGGSITGSGGTLTGASYAVESGSVSAILGGAVALTKSTAGTVTLSSTSTYSGATTVSAGTLYVTGALSNSAVTVEANGTVGSNGAAGTLGNGLSILAGGKLDLTGATLVAGGSSTNILGITGGMLTLGNLAFTDLIGWNYASAADGTYELIDGIFTVDFGTTPNTALTAYNLGGNKRGYFTSGSLNAVIFTVPEPSTALLGAIGLLALLRRRRA